MPELRVVGNPPLDSINTLGVMLWPDELQAEARNAFIASEYVATSIDSAPSQESSWPTDVVRWLMLGPTRDEVKARVVKQTKRATLAGQVFASMFLMELNKEKLPRRGANGPSIDKAISIAMKWAATGVTFGDGSKVPASSKSVKECWAEFRSVSHFWGALEIMRLTKPQETLAALKPNDLHIFLSAAAYMQMFGTTFELTNKSGSASPTLLSKPDLWWLDTEIIKAKIWLPKDNKIFDNAPFMEYLRQYRA